MRHLVYLAVATTAVYAVPEPASAQGQPPAPTHDVTALAKETQNPVGTLISVPLQFNFNTGGDLEDRTFLNLNLQPVMPFRASAQWNAIARVIVPVDSFPGSADTRYSGVGDIQAQLFITPSKPGRIIWGAGPMFSFPTATSSAFESGTWAAGPAVVLVKSTGAFVLGSLVSQVWPLSDAGGAPETNLFTVHPFVNYNAGGGWAVSFAPIMTANWNASDGNEWTVPLGLGVTKTTVFNHRPVNVGVNYFYNVERPDGAAGQQLRFVLSLLFPR